MAARMATSISPGLADKFKKYLIQFAHHHLDFRAQEIKSIISLLGCEASIKEEDLSNGCPFMEISLQQEEDGRNIMSRSVLSKKLYELWAEGSSVEEVKAKIAELPREFTEPHANRDKSFRVMVETFNKKINTAEKIKKIEQITDSESVFQGKINLSSPDVSFHLMEFYEWDDGQPKSTPLKVYFGRWIANGQRDRIQEYHLQKRHFIANTSMDACLSMVMANLAQVKQNDLIMDPFVGSGSLLVSSAHFGAYVMGTDIDYMLLHARAKPSRAKQKTRQQDESVRSNLRQYGLEQKYVDVLVADASRFQMWRQASRFDAIITDPPYGIRESAERIASAETSRVVEGAPHYPQKAAYQLGDIYKDLLNFAANFLVLGGRLVYWVPIYLPDYHESNIPTHPCFVMESNCEQPLNATVSRRLITMVKVKELQDGGTDQATIAVNQYETASFRQKYFKMSNGATGNGKSSTRNKKSSNSTNAVAGL